MLLLFTHGWINLYLNFKIIIPIFKNIFIWWNGADDIQNCYKILEKKKKNNRRNTNTKNNNKNKKRTKVNLTQLLN